MRSRPDTDIAPYLLRLLPREHLEHGRDRSVFSSTSKQISSRAKQCTGGLKSKDPKKE